MSKTIHLGVDLGSISANLVAFAPDDEVVFSAWRRVEGDPIAAVQQVLRELRENLGGEPAVAGVGVTGSGRRLAAALLGADVVKNEITAHASAAIHLHPEVRTIFEIGGQDSKVTLVRDGAVTDFAMNLVCAAGTGSFLDSQALRLGITIEELSARAVRSTSPTDIAGRCTVFAESDMIHKQQTGYRQEDILMGLCLAMARNFLNNVCAGKVLTPPIVFQGGVSANLGIRRAFRELLGFDLIIPRHHLVMGAYGAALLAARNRGRFSRFRGFAPATSPTATRSFVCRDCDNRCEIVELATADGVLGRGGGRCRKWEAAAGPP